MINSDTGSDLYNELVMRILKRQSPVTNRFQALFNAYEENTKYEEGNYFMKYLLAIIIGCHLLMETDKNPTSKQFYFLVLSPAM